jgi:hypothetical protein
MKKPYTPPRLEPAGVYSIMVGGSPIRIPIQEVGEASLAATENLYKSVGGDPAPLGGALGSRTRLASPLA